MISALRFILRSLFRGRGYALVVTFTLSLGIGILASIFGLTKWVIFQADPFPEANRLVAVHLKDIKGMGGLLLYALEAQSIADANAEHQSPFEDVAISHTELRNVVVSGVPVANSDIRITQPFFKMFGVKLFAGRPFSAEECNIGAQVVVISYQFWQKHFGGDSATIGKSLILGEEPCVIVGILGKDQKLPLNFAGEVLRPFGQIADEFKPLDGMHAVVVRLKSGVHPSEASAFIKTISNPFPPQFKQFVNNRQLVASPLSDMSDIFQPWQYWMLFLSGAFLFCVSILNAVCLTSIRLSVQCRDWSTRIALGSSYQRVAWHIAGEIGGLILFSLIGASLVNAFSFPLFAQVAGNASVTAASTLQNPIFLGPILIGGIIAFAVVVFLSILQVVSVPVIDGLKNGSGGSWGGGKITKLRRIVVLAEIAFAIVLLAGSGLMLETFIRLTHRNFGFSPQHLVKVHVVIPYDYKAEKENRLQLLKEVQNRLRLMPGVKDVAYGSDMLLSGWYATLDTVTTKRGEKLPVQCDFVSTNYYDVAGLTLMEGSWFQKSEATSEVLLNETLAHTLYGQDSGVAQPLKGTSPESNWQVVGILHDIPESIRTPIGNHVYCPAYFYPQAISVFIVRTNDYAALDLRRNVAKVVYDYDSRIIVTNVIDADHWILQSTSIERLALTILRTLSIISTLVALVGLFAVLLFETAQRKKEFAIRIAVGATSGSLQRLVVFQGFRIVIAGIVAGFIAAAWLTRFIQALLFGTKALDPIVYLSVVVVMVTIGLLACWIPALRASKVQVMQLLKSE